MNAYFPTVHPTEYMTDIALVKQDIEPGKTERAKALFKEAGQMRNTDEAIKMLAKEGVYTESAFLQQSDEGDSILYFVECEDGEQAFDVYQDIVADPEEEAEGLEELIHEFNSVMAGEPYVAEADPLYHLVNPERL